MGEVETEGKMVVVGFGWEVEQSVAGTAALAAVDEGGRAKWRKV